MLMTAPLLVELAHVVPQPWRNGGGLTRELLAWPNAADWQLRLSVADIERDGPFSAFPGVQRWFCVLQGEGVALQFHSHTQSLLVGDPPLVFDGAAAPGCHLLGGPTRDLNLMLRGLGAGAAGGLEPVQAGQPWQPNAGVCGLFTAVSGVCHEGDTRAWALKPYSLLWWGAARPALRLRFEPAQPLAAVPGWWVHAGALPSPP
jgi:uncharacterized protein